MPSINLPITDLMSTVERPVIFSVIRQLMALTGIAESTLIRFFGEDAKAAQWNSTIGEKSPLQNLWPHRDAITIEVEEDFDPNHIFNMAVKEPENPYLFVDRNLNVMVHPIYSPTQVVVRVVYHGVDKNEALRWRNDVRTRAAQGREINLHRLQYSYTLPQPFQRLLENIFDLRSAVGSDNLSLEQWWYQCASPKFTRVVTQGGTHPQIVVAETQGMVQGLFDFEGVPEKQSKSDEADMWELSFSYRFKYDKPISMNAKYPLLVHQQPIDAVFRQSNVSMYDKLLRELSLSGRYFAGFQGDLQMAKYLANKGVTLPLEDDWVPLQGTVPTSTVKALTAMVTISADDKRTLLDLKDLGDYQIVQKVLDFMAQSEYPYMTGHAASIFQVTVYEGYNVLPVADVEVTSDLVLRATRDLDLTKLYHVRLGLVAQMVALQSTALARLRAYADRDLIPLLIQALNGSLSAVGKAPDLRKSSLDAYDLGLLGVQSTVPTTYGYSLFQTLFVVANRASQFKPSTPPPVAIDQPQPYVNV